MSIFLTNSIFIRSSHRFVCFRNGKCGGILGWRLEVDGTWKIQAGTHLKMAPPRLSHIPWKSSELCWAAAFCVSFPLAWAPRANHFSLSAASLTLAAFHLIHWNNKQLCLFYPRRQSRTFLLDFCFVPALLEKGKRWSDLGRKRGV